MPSCQVAPGWSRQGRCPPGVDGGVQAHVHRCPGSGLCLILLVLGARPLRRSSMRGCAESSGPTVAVSSWMLPTCEGCAMGASARHPATPASPTTLRSSPCGSWPTLSSAQVHARKWCLLLLFSGYTSVNMPPSCQACAGHRVCEHVSCVALCRHSVNRVVSDGSCFSRVRPLLLQFEVQILCCGEDF